MNPSDDPATWRFGRPEPARLDADDSLPQVSRPDPGRMCLNGTRGGQRTPEPVTALCET